MEESEKLIDSFCHAEKGEVGGEETRKGAVNKLITRSGNYYSTVPQIPGPIPDHEDIFFTTSRPI